MPNSRIPKAVFEWDLKLRGMGKKSWSFHPNKLFEQLNCTNIQTDSSGIFCATVWDAITSSCLSKWRQEVQGVESGRSESGGKLALYRKFKSSPKLEPYVKLNLPVKVRRVVAGLRAGCLPLQIELGRYTQPKTPLKERICPVCTEEVQSQEHFLVRCEPLRESRNKLLDVVCKDKDPSIYSDQALCHSTLNPQTLIYKTCKAIYSLYVARCNLIYTQKAM